MDKIYEQAKDQHVATTIVYGYFDIETSGKEYAYQDIECTKPFTKSELEDAYIKGALIKFVDFDGTTTKPNACQIMANTCVISYVMSDSDGALVMRGLMSVEDEITE